jgi:hypothetical protein
LSNGRVATLVVQQFANQDRLLLDDAVKAINSLEGFGVEDLGGHLITGKMNEFNNQLNNNHYFLPLSQQLQPPVSLQLWGNMPESMGRSIEVNNNNAPVSASRGTAPRVHGRYHTNPLIKCKRCRWVALSQTRWQALRCVVFWQSDKSIEKTALNRFLRERK